MRPPDFQRSISDTASVWTGSDMKITFLNWIKPDLQSLTVTSSPALMLGILKFTYHLQTDDFFVHGLGCLNCIRRFPSGRLVARLGLLS